MIISVDTLCGFAPLFANVGMTGWLVEPARLINQGCASTY